MATDIRLLSTRARIGYGVACIALGCYPIALGLGIVEADSGLAAPPWVVVSAGLAFIIAGSMILFAHNSRANDLFAGILLLLFCATGIWVAGFSSDQGFSGGLPFVSRETNIMIGRWLFGLGALISFAMAVYALRRATSVSARSPSDTPPQRER